MPKSVLELLRSTPKSSSEKKSPFALLSSLEVNKNPQPEPEPEVIEFAEPRVLNAIHLSDTEQREEGGFVVKEILRTGEWPEIPTTMGVRKRPLRIVRDGKSSAEKGIISLQELVENFNAGAVDRVQIPLSDDNNDHKNITRTNTGYVRDLWIEDRDGGDSRLFAKMEFTEPDVREKVLRGTYADVSCGMPWNHRLRGKTYGVALEHVAITNRPFIDDLGPFLAASAQQQEEVEMIHFGNANLLEPEVEVPEPERKKEAPVVKPTASRSTSVKDELEAAQFTRQLMLSRSTSTKEENMPLTREELESLDLSDEQKAAFLDILNENAQLSAQTRESEADQRVEELKELGLEERPGFLKFYRSVYLSTDSSPAVVLSAENGQEEGLTALEILDKSIEALKGSDGKVQLSAQALASGNDNKPPATADGEVEKPLEERLAEAREAIHGKK